MRRRLLIFGIIVLSPVMVLGVEVLIARSGQRLDDETGFRPADLVVRPGDRPTTVVWLGDSTSTGVGVAAVEDSMAHRVTASITDGPVTLTILGESGAQVHEVLDRQIPELADRAVAGDVPDIVLVSIGANDVTALTRRPTFEGRYESVVERVGLIAPESRIVLVGIPDMGTAPRLPVPLRQIAGRRAAQLDGVIEEIAGEQGLLHVDLASRTSGIFSSDPDRYFSADRFHPSAAGHRIWADAVVAAVDEHAGTPEPAG